MEHPRSFRSLVHGTTGSGKPPTPTTKTTSAAPTAVPAPAKPTTAPTSITPTTAPASARPTTAPASARPTTAPASAKPATVPASKPLTRTEVVAALAAPLPSDRDAKKAAKGKGQVGDDRKRSFDRDDVIDVDREPKNAQARSASPPRRMSRSVFQDKASASSLFSTLVFHNDVMALINTESSGDMMRQGLKFLALVNKVGHELEAEVEDLKKKLEAETCRTENVCTAADGLRVERNAAWASIDKKNKELTDQAKEIVSLKAEARKSVEAFLTKAERSAIALAAAEEREQCSAAIMTKRDGELATAVEKLRKADGHLQSLERKFARVKGKFDELQGDPRSNMVYQVQRVANLNFVKLFLGLLDGHDPPKLEDELTFLPADVAGHAGDEERFEQLMTSLHGLFHVLDPKVKAPTVVAHDRTLETYAVSFGVADTSGSLLGGAGSRKAAVVGVDGKFSLIGGVGA
ncbi:hypothetical protein AALP_AA6G346000 [Arabis alpina]|uniref:Uncharacterized protein n=1 Tax=Arabis alpina TaxID=50452 RepID=A0A087GTL7_ARAAL|nr:hypothetical protein AALP_AA6G346000 [Arabis alpina]